MHIVKTVILSFLVLQQLPAQHASAIDSMPYSFIESYPEHHNSASIIQRMIDGLGYRYYWASEGLDEQVLAYKAEEGSRTIHELLTHIFELSNGIRQFAEGEALTGLDTGESLSLEALRLGTLNNLKAASDLFAGIDDAALFEMKVKFKRGERSREFEFWHIINGPISDALYHVGQVVYNRRAAGNPINPAVSVFMGANRF